jgi:hypothetical protein
MNAQSRQYTNAAMRKAVLNSLSRLLCAAVKLTEQRIQFLLFVLHSRPLAQWVSGLPVAIPLNPVLHEVANVIFPVLSSAIEDEGNKVILNTQAFECPYRRLASYCAVAGVH